ncbi:hypothetical protein G6M26_10130, partial [Agrobacterium tumefaciens]|nr:hypothetical protein [Agrobacterium tumefaciens]
MKKFYKKVFRFLFIVLALIISTLNASAALSKGDLAVIGMNGDADPSTTIRSFAVVALNTINTGELIYFTDRGWINTYSSTSGHFVASSTATVEGTFQWQLSQNITAGTIIIFKIDLASRTVSGITGNGTSLPAADLLSILPNTWTNATLSANPWNPATGDQIMIYQGSDSSPSFIFAFNNIRLTTTAGTTSNGWHINTTNSEPSSQLAGYSELPSDLGTTYSTGFLTPTSNSRYPNEKYNPSFSTGTKATFLADITNTSNWTNKTTGGTPYDFSAGFGTNNTKQFNFSNSTAPTVTAAKISISGASGTGGAYKIGDVVTATWDNTTGGDNNSGVTTVTIDFSQFGGGTAVTATNSSDTWTATYTIVAGNINATNRNVSVTATNSVGPTTTADDANATVDNIAPSVVISSTAGSSGGSTSTSPIPFTVTFSETVTGFLAGDITPGNATISGFSGNGTTYTFNATPTANGAVTINIAANVAQDAAGNGNAAASQFSITYTQAVAAPTVTALSPTSGPTGGGTSVTITGTNFSGATAVTFGATAATGFTVNSATQITATAPAGTGTVDVRITTTGGTSAISASDQFTYVAAPTVTALSPTSGPTGGGTSVTITGTNFSGTTAVTFGATAATGFTVNSATQITATAPAGTGTVDVRITTTGGTSATSASDQFTYALSSTAAPVAIIPANGSLTTTTTPTYAGTAPAGSTITVYVDGTALGSTTTATAGGNWAITQPTALAQGSHTVYATAQISGNAVSANSNTNTFTVDSTRPSVVISSTAGASGSSTSTSPIPFTVTFSESVTGFVAGDVTPGNATISGFSGSGTTYTFNATPTANGAVTINIAANVAQDAAGNGNTAASQYSITYSQTVTAAPVVIIPANGSLTTTTTPTYAGTAPAGSTITVYLDGTALGSTTTATAGGNWAITQPTALAQGSHTVYATAQISGNAVSANSNTNTFTVDSTRPSVVISSTAGASGSSTSTSPIPFTVTFSESVTGFVAGDVTPGNATISGFSGSGTTYTFNATPTANGAVTINIAANVAQDAAGNGNTAASQYSITYTQPSVITASAGTFPSALSTTYGTASASTSVSVSGTGLSAGITATPSSTSNFEVSADNVSYSSSVTIGSSGTVSGTVYVRLKANAPAGTNITGNVTLTSTNANSTTVSIPSSTVAKATLIYTANTSSKVYGDAVPTLSGTVTGFVNSETISTATTGTLSWSTPASTNSSAGSYGITGTGLSANNYDFVQASSNATALTVTTKTVTVTAAAKSKTYGDADPALTYTFAPVLVGTDTFTGSLTRTPGENVGTYAINQGTLALNSNYTLTYVGADLTIGAKTVTVTAAAKSKTYGDADPALTYTFAPALVSGDSFSGSLTRTPGENVGTYAINQGTLALNSNYTLTYVGADLTIGAKTVTVTAAAKSKTYGDADPALTYTFAPALVGTDTFTGSLTRTPGENVGTYAINQGTLALNSNYTLTYVGADLTIGAKTVTVTAAAKSKTYGDADPALTYTFAPVLVGTDTFTGSLTRAPGENVGTYAINQGTLALNSNYTLTYVGADLTIGAKTVTVTAAAKSKTYGDADPALTYTFAPALTGTDTFTGSLTRSPGENVGTYAINQGTLALNGNYTLTYISADLTIGAKTVTVTAAAKSKTYGDADPALTYTFAPALTGTDTFTGSLTRSPGENVGTYAINQGTLALNGNYTLTYISADLTIGAK